MAKFQKTSLQVSPIVLHDLDHWPGLTRSEALRLVLERGHYLSTLGSAELSEIADKYAPILEPALADLDYDDYKVAARSLPAIVTGFLAEANRSWRAEHRDGRELDPKELIEKLQKLTAVERIEILDCVIAERHRRAEKDKSK